MIPQRLLGSCSSYKISACAGITGVGGAILSIDCHPRESSGLQYRDLLQAAWSTSEVLDKVPIRRTAVCAGRA